MLVLVGIGVLITAVSVTVAAFHGLLVLDRAVGYCGIVLFGLGTFVALWRLFAQIPGEVEKDAPAEGPAGPPGKAAFR